jgi:hypothetical protein
MMNSSDLHAAIKSNVDNILDPMRVEVTYVESVDDNGIATTKTLAKKVFPENTDVEQVLIDAICKAVAEEVIKHIQNKLEISGPPAADASIPIMSKTGATVTMATLPYTTPLMGVGGGIVGPVTVFPGTIAVMGGNIKIGPGQVS